MKNISRSPFFWIGATALSALFYFFAFHFFPQTFPIINLSITMDLDQAREQADSIAQKNNIGPVNHQSAVMFFSDSTVQTFVELEAGGKQAFIEMMEKQLYMPYQWKVRHFREHEKNESVLLFTPDGKPYGFIEAISENSAGAQLSEKDARAIAESTATNNWNIDFTNYTLVEASQKTEISNRIDHTFTYERSDTKIGEGTYRLKIVVSGDKVTELTPFVKVPEAFIRRYAEMRSANTLIALIASLIMIILYFLLGGIGGLYWIFRKRWHIIKQPILWAGIISLLSILASINQLPFLWMHYNSAFSLYGFLGQLFLRLLIAFIAQTAFYSIIFMAAESLTRKAFGDHPQLWSVFSLYNASSVAIASRVFGAYLLVGFMAAFVIAFYLFSLRYLGWWSPAEMLFDPNMLATYVPWFNPLALSLNAGFMEECLFRAIPLAGAALLGSHFGKRNWWIAVAFILQAIIFGAAHANYPVQPSYARLIELLIPSFIFAGMYLKWGLLVSIIAHTVYDIIWFSIPIFLSQTADTVAYKIIIILFALLPLLRVIYARLRVGTWQLLSPQARNAAWQVTALNEETKETIKDETVSEIAPTPTIAKKYILILGTIGAIAWLGTTRFTHDGITISIDRAQATAAAHHFLGQKNIALAEPWQTLPLIFTHYGQVPEIALQHKFIWKKGKKDLYHALLGTYLEPAHWTIRYAQFDTDIIARTEEHKIMFYNDSLYRYYHQLPESTPGASLTQQEARLIAQQTIRNQFNLDPTQLTEISATQTQLPHRINWLFVFTNPDTTVYPLELGQARISIALSGDEVIDAARTIHVPEEWIRTQANKDNTLNIVMMIFGLLLIFLLISGLILATRQKRTFYFSKKLFYGTCILSLTIAGIEIITMWPSIIGIFNTSIPLNTQLIQTLSSLIIFTIIKSIAYATLLTYALSYAPQQKLIPLNIHSIATGMSCGLFVAGLFSCIQLLIAIKMPLWPSYDPLSSSWPLLASALGSITRYASMTMIFSLLCMLINTGTMHWKKNRFFFVLLALVCGMGMVGLPSIKMIPLWIIVGSAIGYILLMLYRCIIRYNYSIIALATGTYYILQLIQQGIFNAYPYAWLAAVINICTIILLSIAWYRCNYSIKKKLSQ